MNKLKETPLPLSLDQITVRTPCTMDWELMDGDQRMRFCDKCQKNVFNLAEMTEAEALTLIRSSGDSVCGRLFKRSDGTVVTADCPTKTAPSFWRRPFQFSIATLLVVMTASAGLAASAPWIGKKIEPLVQWMFPGEDPVQYEPNSMMVGLIDITPAPDEDVPPEHIPE